LKALAAAELARSRLDAVRDVKCMVNEWGQEYSKKARINTALDTV
jgi:hypothetical protein